MADGPQTTPEQDADVAKLKLTMSYSELVKATGRSLGQLQGMIARHQKRLADHGEKISKAKKAVKEARAEAARETVGSVLRLIEHRPDQKDPLEQLLDLQTRAAILALENYMASSDPDQSRAHAAIMTAHAQTRKTYKLDGDKKEDEMPDIESEIQALKEMRAKDKRA